jgi:uncharacterized protein
MRTPHNDPELTVSDAVTPASAPGDGDPALEPRGTFASAQRAQATPERRCVLTGVHGGRDDLIRLALSPDGDVHPDLAARAPGRGAWLAVDRAALEIALTKGKLKGALMRAFRGAPVTIAADLPDRIDQAFERLLLAQFGLASRAGALLSGADKIDTAARAGQVLLLLHAADAAEDGRRKRDQSWRVGEDREGSGVEGEILPIDRARLSIALGRDNAVHIAIIDAGFAARISALLKRWHRFAGSSRGSGHAAPETRPAGETRAETAAAKDD